METVHFVNRTPNTCSLLWYMQNALFTVFRDQVNQCKYSIFQATVQRPTATDNSPTSNRTLFSQPAGVTLSTTSSTGRQRSQVRVVCSSLIDLHIILISRHNKMVEDSNVVLDLRGCRLVLRLIYTCIRHTPLVQHAM